MVIGDLIELVPELHHFPGVLLERRPELRLLLANPLDFLGDGRVGSPGLRELADERIDSLFAHAPHALPGVGRKEVCGFAIQSPGVLEEGHVPPELLDHLDVVGLDARDEVSRREGLPLLLGIEAGVDEFLGEEDVELAYLGENLPGGFLRHALKLLPRRRRKEVLRFAVQTPGRLKLRELLPDARDRAFDRMEGKVEALPGVCHALEFFLGGLGCAAPNPFPDDAL